MEVCFGIKKAAFVAEAVGSGPAAIAAAWAKFGPVDPTKSDENVAADLWSMWVACGIGWPAGASKNDARKAST